MPFFIRLPPNAILHIRKKQFETITQIPHTGVRIPLQLKALWDDLDRPVHQLGMLPRLEAQVEVAWILRVDAELVDGAFGVGFGVGG